MLLGQVTKLDYEYYVSVKFPKTGNCTIGDYIREYPCFLGNAYWLKRKKKVNLPPNLSLPIRPQFPSQRHQLAPVPSSWARVNFTASHESPGYTALSSSWLVPKSRFPVLGT